MRTEWSVSKDERLFGYGKVIFLDGDTTRWWIIFGWCFTRIRTKHGKV